jgi:hypothetical protein
MGWGRMMLLGNVGQQFDIHDLRDEIERMQNTVGQNQDLDQSQADEIQRLKAENRELKLYVATVVRLLVSKGVLQQGEIDAAVEMIDKGKS